MTSAKFTQEFIRVDACLKTDTRYILFDSVSSSDSDSDSDSVSGCDSDFDSDCDSESESFADSDDVVACAKLGP